MPISKKTSNTLSHKYRICFQRSKEKKMNYTLSMNNLGLLRKWKRNSKINHLNSNKLKSASKRKQNIWMRHCRDWNKLKIRKMLWSKVWAKSKENMRNLKKNFHNCRFCWRVWRMSMKKLVSVIKSKMMDQDISLLAMCSKPICKRISSWKNWRDCTRIRMSRKQNFFSLSLWWRGWIPTNWSTTKRNILCW